VVVEFERQPVPQLQRVVVDARALVIEIVGTDDRGVAARIAAAEPALFHHGDIGDAVFPGEVIGGCQAMAAGPDDDDVVFGLRLGRGPLFLPALVSAKCFAGDGEGGKLAHSSGSGSICISSAWLRPPRCTTSQKPLSLLHCLRRRMAYCTKRQKAPEAA